MPINNATRKLFYQKKKMFKRNMATEKQIYKLEHRKFLHKIIKLNTPI